MQNDTSGEGESLAGIIEAGARAEPGFEREPSEEEREAASRAGQEQELTGKNLQAIRMALAMGAGFAVQKGFPSVGKIPRETVDGFAVPAAGILASYGIDLDGYVNHSPWVALAFGAWGLVAAVNAAIEHDKENARAAAAKPVEPAPGA